MQQEKLAALHKKFDQINTSGLKKTATQAVFGHGNALSDIIFIGEAPGKSEDISGKPFVGASGKFLDEMLTSIKLSREDVYITNIVKYRPPENRDPSKDEIAACKAWLHAELQLIQPKLVITLGRYALNHFIPDVKIGEVHGKSFTKNIPGLGEQTFFALYHPAAALYNGNMRETLLKDFKKITRLLKK
ncbi:MAG: uracil-DNA glycosylase [Candidatus Moranbacteria bacterium]|nr:uracil-DNA glycosylase [Candidatus Moranbacteria bacterium]